MIIGDILNILYTEQSEDDAAPAKQVKTEKFTIAQKGVGQSIASGDTGSGGYASAFRCKMADIIQGADRLLLNLKYRKRLFKPFTGVKIKVPDASGEAQARMDLFSELSRWQKETPHSAAHAGKRKRSIKAR